MPIKPIFACLLAVVPLFLSGCKGKPPFMRLDDPAENPVKKLLYHANDSTRIDSAVSGNKGPARFAECAAKIAIPASAIITISPPAGGIVRTILYSAGAYVHSGKILATIENIDFLKLQQEYLEAKSQFFYLGEELKRQGELTLENATSVKKMQQTQLDYQTCEIKFRSLGKQLALCGFSADSLDVDHYSSLMSIHAPISGFIDKISVHPGNPVSTGENLIVMVRSYHPVLLVDIPEKFYRHIKKGLPVAFFLPGDSVVPHKATLSFISNHIDTGSHMIRARAIPADRSLLLIPGMQVSVRIILADPDI